jgi:hypothetical protein
MTNANCNNIIVTNCTFTDNEAETEGGAICNYSSDVTMTNCILWGNGTEIYNDLESTLIAGFSNIQGGYPGSDNIDEDPLFVNAPTDVSLQADSPCIDTGTDTSGVGYGGVVDDILGIKRPQGSAYDMGAYEYTWDESTPVSPVSVQPLVRTNLEKLLGVWACLVAHLPNEDSNEVDALVARIQGHVENAAQLTNPVYASGQLSKALALMSELDALLQSGCMDE